MLLTTLIAWQAGTPIAVAGGLTDVAGLEVGHHTLEERPTGCTVVLTGPEGAVAGVDIRGGAPGTREIALLDPVNHVQKAHALVLSGGSAFGLDSATGVVRYLEEHDIGYPTRVAKVPIVPAAILFDLGVGVARTHEARLDHHSLNGSQRRDECVRQSYGKELEFLVRAQVHPAGVVAMKLGRLCEYIYSAP